MGRRGFQKDTEAARKVGKATQERQLQAHSLRRQLAPILANPKFAAVFDPDKFLATEANPVLLKQIVQALRPEIDKIRQQCDEIISIEDEYLHRLDVLEARHASGTWDNWQPTEKDLLSELGKLPGPQIFRATQSAERRTAEKEAKDIKSDGEKNKALDDFWNNWGPPPSFPVKM